MDESAFLARLRGGDERAYEELVREQSPRLLAVARRLLPTEDDAYDALQDGFASAFRGIGSFDGKSKLSTWLHRIVVNAALMKLRTKRRHPERSIEDLLPKFKQDGHAWEPAAPWRPLTDELEEGEVRDHVREAIETLPEGYRNVLLLRDIEGMDTSAAAAVLEISENAVKTRLHRARQALRELLKPWMEKSTP